MSPAQHRRQVDPPPPSLVPQAVDFLERLPFPASLTDLGHRFLAINTAHARAYGWQPDQLVGQSPRLLTPGEVSEAFLLELDAATQRGGWHGRLLNRTRRGRVFEVLLHTLPIRAAAGQVLLLGVAGRPGQEGELTRCLMELARRGALLAAPAGVEPSLKALTPRECETFRLLGLGLRTAEIAFHLGVAFNTARVFIASVRVKLGCANLETLRARAARWPH